jgi:hypothetical protein
MFFQIGIQCFGMGLDVDVDMGMGVGLSMGVGVGMDFFWMNDVSLAPSHARLKFVCLMCQK